ncbi:MAG TPA: ATP-binding protein [Patescibacteria group bacterium]|nr:ATP-binding protein [Patescibacteria group bacterium]
MVSAVFVTDAVIGTLLIMLGLLAVLKDSKAFLNRIFFLLVVSVSFWIMSNLYSNDQSLTQFQNLAANHLTLFFPGLSLLFFTDFISTLAGSVFYKRWQTLFVGFLGFIYILSLTPLVVRGIEMQGSVYAINFGPLAAVYFLALILNIILATVLLAIGIRHSDGPERARLVVIGWSILVTVIINLATNAFVPIVFDSFALTNFGPISTLAIVAGLFYSITKHQLFDMRLVIARSMGYLFSILALGILYGMVTFMLVGHILFPRNDVTFKQQVVVASIAAGITILFQPIKQFFDHLTRAIFYKDGYDSQEFLNRLNRVLVGSLGLTSLLNNASHDITDCLRLNTCFFVINDPKARNNLMVFGQQKPASLSKNIDHILQEASISRENVIVTGMLEGRRPIKALLTSEDIGAVARLEANQDHGVLGYLILGIKKNGSSFTSQDLKLVDIVGQELVIAIQNNLRFEEIEAFNETLQEKVEDATRQLRRSNEKLRKLDQTKDDFISMASHQLRTPLTSVKGYVSMVLDGDVGPISKIQRKLLTQSFVSSQRMVYLISDLLNVSRLKTGNFILEPARTNLAKVVQEEVSQLVDSAKSRNLELTYHKPEQFPVLMLDETKLRQVIMNFVDNAVYYTPSGGHIVVNLVDKPKTIEFTVTDDGIGVPKQDQHHLFSKFFRARNAKRARPDGTGLGLFMAKKVIVAQGGAVILKSQEGRGSTFGFIFAKAPLTPPEPVRKPVKN